MGTKFGSEEVCVQEPSAELKRELGDLHALWQEAARAEISFRVASSEVGNFLECEKLQPASLVVGRGRGRAKRHRRVATKWCVRRLQEAAQVWTPEGANWWRKLMARPGQWMKDDLLRLQRAKLLE